MAFSERFMDSSYPYEMGQLPYAHRPYHPCFGSGPHMKVEQPRVRGEYPSQCHHGCCNHGYFGGPGSRAAYPHCTQPSAPFSHHGGYPRYDAACPVPYESEQYGYGPRNYGCSGSGSGCCSHSSGCGVENPTVEERKPEVYERKTCNETNDPQESAEAWPWLFGYDPLTGRMNGGGRSKSQNVPNHIRSCDGKVNSQPFVCPADRTMDRSSEAYPSKKVRTIEVKDMSKADQNKNARDKKGSLNSVGADSVPIKIQIKEKKPDKVVDVKMKKSFSNKEAAVLVQSVYRGYEVRKLELLNKLKKIANIREQAAGLEDRIQSLVTLSSGPIDEKQRLIIEETIMSLLLKLDDIQGLPAQYRENRKSAARELTKMQERLDALTSQKLEEVKELKELKEVDGHDGTEVECGDERCEEDYLQQLMDQDEPAIPDQSTVSLCSATEKEDHGEGVRDVEVTDSEKVVMDVDLEMNPNAKPEVNLNAELEVIPIDKAARGYEAEAAELEVDDADHTCPKSVGLDNEIPSDAQLESDRSEMRTRGEAERYVGMLLSSTEAPVNEVFNEAQVESGGTESVTRLDSESAVVTLSSPEPSVMENDTPHGTGVEADAVEPETRVELEGEVLDGTFSSPIPAEQGEVEGTMIESGEKLMKENEELRKLTEKLIEVTKEQSAVISDLNKRVDSLEKRLSANKQNAMKNKRRK